MPKLCQNNGKKSPAEEVRILLIQTRLKYVGAANQQLQH